MKRNKNIDQHEYRARYLEKCSGYTFKINWTSDRPFDPKNSLVEVILILEDGQEYTSDFITRKKIEEVFEENKQTGYCADGTYYCRPNMIIVDEITEETIKKTIDDLASTSKPLEEKGYSAFLLR